MEVNYLFEIWKDIKGYDGYYQVSNLGRIKNMKTNYILKPTPNKQRGGYLSLILSLNGVHTRRYVHRLVAETFIPNTLNLPEINHKDEDPTNNSVDNLEWCDHLYNQKYGTRTQRAGEGHRKPINQYSLDGILIKRWSSALEIENKTGYCHSAIRKCCNGTYAQAYGYIWKDAI